MRLPPPSSEYRRASSRRPSSPAKGSRASSSSTSARSSSTDLTSPPRGGRARSRLAPPSPLPPARGEPRRPAPGRRSPRGERGPPPSASGAPPGARRGRSRARSPGRLPNDAPEDPIHQAARILGGVTLRERDRLVDRRLERHVAAFQLPEGDPEDVSLEGAEPVGAPFARSIVDAGVELGCLARDGVDELLGIGVELALMERGERRPGDVPLVEDEESVAARRLAAHELPPSAARSASPRNAVV